ncbi:MAG: aryl-sulfate sulfotransferase [Bacteroidota bacterium]
MKRRLLRSIYLLGIVFFLSSCGMDPSTEIITTIGVQLNPTGVAPLTAQITLTTSVPVSAEVIVEGRRGLESNLVQVFPEFGRDLNIPVLGLYANYSNDVTLNLLDASGNILVTRGFRFQTDSLIADMPEIRIDKADPARMEPGFNFVNYFGFDDIFNPQRPFIFDQYGDIRWYIDFTSHPSLVTLFYDNGMFRMENGNLVFGDGNTASVYEMDMLGNIVRSRQLDGAGFHHQVMEIPNGNVLVTVNDYSKQTKEDVIFELDWDNGGNTIHSWDLNQSLDNSRRAWPTDLADLNVDWFHANGLAYDETDKTLIVSGRTQGTVKLTYNNQVVWILAPHRDWGTSGSGIDLKQFLLQPLDAQGNPITDPAVLDGTVNHSDFEWPWYQHSPEIMPNGNILLFDNGDNRNYTGQELYSRAVEYKIDEEKMTIQQVWDYGKERGEETYARIVSRVSYYPSTNNVIFTPGRSYENGNPVGKIVEINKDTDEVVFEASIFPPQGLFDITFHNARRGRLY